jgi:hypothetical protein
MIAKVSESKLEVTLAGYNTDVTQSRINALLEAFSSNHTRVCTRNGVPHVSSESQKPWPINSKEWILVPTAQADIRLAA